MVTCLLPYSLERFNLQPMETHGFHLQSQNSFMPMSFHSSHEFQEFHEIHFTEFISIPVFSFPWLFSVCARHWEQPCVFDASHSTKNEFPKDQ